MNTQLTNKQSNYYTINDYTIDYMHSQMTIQSTIYIMQMNIQLTIYAVK